MAALAIRLRENRCERNRGSCPNPSIRAGHCLPKQGQIRRQSSPALPRRKAAQPTPNTTQLASGQVLVLDEPNGGNGSDDTEGSTRICRISRSMRSARARCKVTNSARGIGGGSATRSNGAFSGANGAISRDKQAMAAFVRTAAGKSRFLWMSESVAYAEAPSVIRASSARSRSFSSTVSRSRMVSWRMSSSLSSIMAGDPKALERLVTEQAAACAGYPSKAAGPHSWPGSWQRQNDTAQRRPDAPL